MVTAAMPSTHDRRRERRRALIRELRERFQFLVQRTLALRHLLEELWFEREQFETNNPKLLRAGGHDWTTAYIVTVALVAAWVIDRTILKPTLEFMLLMMSESATLIAIGVYVMPLVAIFLDVLIGSMAWKVLEKRSRLEIGLIPVLLWLVLAAAWVSMMPAFTIEAHRAAVGASDAGTASYGWQLWGMVVLALAAHGGIVLAGGIIHDSITLLMASRRYCRLSAEIRRVREDYFKAASGAVAAYGEHDHAVVLFNRDYPADPVGILTLDLTTSELLAESMSTAPSVTSSTKSGSVN
jgi:hypothetical protein